MKCAILNRGAVSLRTRLSPIFPGVLACWLILVLLPAACTRGADTPTPARTPLVGGGGDLPDARARAALGASTFAQHCTPCHGAEGRGDGVAGKVLEPPVPDLTDWQVTADSSPQDFYLAIAEGVPGSAMLRWDQLLEPMDIWDTAFYSWELGTSPEMLARGDAVWKDKCASCHGADGQGVDDHPLADPSRVVNRRQAAVSALMSTHPDLVGPMDDSDRVAVTERMWAFLYTPAWEEAAATEAATP
jgi:mono/diheme cytochrome c family protein